MIVIVGLSHKTAPIEVRERAALQEDAQVLLLQELTRLGSVAEAMAVSTCNRVEIVAAGRDAAAPETTLDEITRLLNEQLPGVAQHLYHKSGDPALQHLFRVTSSLDSLVMGEPQILGQVKSALELGRRAGTVGAELNRAVGHALRTAKRVRSETAIGVGQVSVPSVAVDLARQIFGQLEGRGAALVGSGAMGEAAAKLLSAAGAKLFIVGRNRERTEQLSAQLGGTPRPLEALPSTLVEVDVVVTTTSAQGFVIHRDMVKQAHRQRRGRSLFLIDLAVPRDVDPSVDTLDSTFLYNVDHLSDLVAQSLSSRQREADRAEVLIAEATVAFGRALNAEQATPTVVQLRSQFSRILQGEIEKSLRGRLKHLDEEDRAALEKMVDASVNKMLHPATRLLRQLAADEAAGTELDSTLNLLKELFELEEPSRSRSLRPSGAGPALQGAELSSGAGSSSSAGSSSGAGASSSAAPTTPASESSDPPPSALLFERSLAHAADGPGKSVPELTKAL